MKKLKYSIDSHCHSSFEQVGSLCASMVFLVMENQEEIWRTIEGFESYQVSNLGAVKSIRHGKENILKASINSHGYRAVSFCKNHKCKTFKIHQLVAIAFLNHKPCGMKLVINHKDFDKLNNNVQNLEIITNRENSNKKHIKSTSKYTGVSWNKHANKWKAHIYINGKFKHLGYFYDEIEASNAYQNKLKEILTIKI